MAPQVSCIGLVLAWIVACAVIGLGGEAFAQRDELRRQGRNAPVTVTSRIGYLGKRYEEPPPLSLVDKILTDNGVQGARIGINYNVTTGNLLGHAYQLEEAIIDPEEDVRAKAKALLAGDIDVIVADLEPADLLAVADLPEAAEAVFFNIRSSDDALRGQNCRANVFHIPPSWAMRADALAQFLLWKKWRRWFVIAGRNPTDLDYAAAIKRAAKRYGAKIVEERSYTFEAGYRRTDDGHQQIQTQMPLLTQGAAEHDVIFVADSSEAFGDYLMWRSHDPRPVVGTHGLVAVGWHRSFEQYAGMQMQNRFERLVGRPMTERDYSAWVAVRSVGEVVTRTGRSGAEAVREYLLSDAFEVAAFKGQGLTFRRWNQQLRQPVLLSGPRSLVSISPQPGFLHEKYLTDTLGFDEPESTCNLRKSND